ncbi:MAG: response regulator [Luteolibacter sp.]
MKRVMVADDDFILTKLYQMHFRRHGIEGEFFTEGGMLLEAAKANPPDAVILDYELPDLHGPEVMERLHGQAGCEAVPVVFVTARADEALEDELVGKGARRVLGKPFAPAELIGALETGS